MSAPQSPLGFTSLTDRKRLLELYPIAALRNQWSHIEGTKDELCFSVASSEPHDSIVNFVREVLSCCRQHIFIYSHPQNLGQLPQINIPDAVTFRADPKREIRFSGKRHFSSRATRTRESRVALYDRHG
jgi:hypothetical protein